MSKSIPLSEPYFYGNEKKYVADAIESTWISGIGEYVDKFENHISQITGAKYVVCCNSGTSALHLALAATSVKENDEVIVPSLTFISTINSILYCNAHPVFFDTDEYFNIDIQSVIQFLENDCEYKNGATYNLKSGRRIAAIIIVHVWGNACDFQLLKNICKDRNIKIIEDAAESLGTTFKQEIFNGNHTGAVGDVGCFSFNGNKIITTGGGGAIATSSIEIAEKVRYLSTQAKDDPFNYTHNEMGFNYRLSNINAAFGFAQLENLGLALDKKREINDLYKQAFSGNPDFLISPSPNYAENNHWLNILRVMNGNKDSILNKLKDNKIEARPIWKLSHEQVYLKNYEAHGIVNAIKQVKECICLPSSLSLEKADIELICDVING